MAGLHAESARHAARMKEAYRGDVARLGLADRRDLQRAHDAGRLAPLPDDPLAFNVQPRIDGRSPIGEMDLPHQALYVAARPEAVGCLLHIAAHVQSGAVEVTSLVRHHAYQRSLARRNTNARTAVPTHVMGLAFDISVLNVPIETAREIRDVLRQMAADGDLFFVAEQRQLVFHVVPAPARRAFYTGLYDAMTAPEPPALPSRPALPHPPSVLDSVPPAVSAAGMLPAGASGQFAPVTYAALFAWLVGSGFGTPPGEDLLMVGAGTMLAEGLFTFWPLALMGFLGVLVSDACLFWCGRTARLSAGRQASRLPGWLRRFAEGSLSRCGGWAIAIARFIPGVRSLVYITAGARGVCPARFLIIDACAAAVWVPLILALGSWAGTAGLGEPAFALW